MSIVLGPGHNLKVRIAQMIKGINKFFWLIFLISAAFSAPAWAKGEEYNKPIPKEAIELVRQAKALRASDKFDDALATLKKTITLAPHFVEAHFLYYETKAYFMDRLDEVRAEYDSLRAKEPGNPVYPMAIVLSLKQPIYGEQALLQKVVDLAPDWAWGHYAKARLAGRNDLETAIAEYNKCIELDKWSRQPYQQLINLVRTRDRNLAIATAKKMADYPGDFYETGQYLLWQLRLAAANGSVEETAKLRAELDKLAETAKDIETLEGIAALYHASFRKDETVYQATVERIRKLDPTWYPERGRQFGMSVQNNEDGLLRQAVFANHDYALLNKKSEISNELLPTETIAELEKILALKPGRQLSELLIHNLLDYAEQAGDATAILKYGEALRKIQPFNLSLPARIAIALANTKTNLDKALDYARIADASTKEFRLPPMPSDVNPDQFKEAMTEETQQRVYKLNRSRALDALGWVLCQKGNCAEGEPKLREAVALKRDKDTLQRFVIALDKVGKTEEAQKIRSEIENLLIASVKEELSRNKEIAKDFTLQSIDGRKISLSELKGKVVMVNFWATWCGPCVAEIPDLKKLYEKYKDKGFELLAISVDDKADQQQVINFAKRQAMNFPVLFDEKARLQYEINAFPTNIFIDREGKVRYKFAGSGLDALQTLELVLNELLK